MEKLIYICLKKSLFALQGTKDSGIEIPILSTTLVPDLKIKSKVLLSSAFGETTEATLGTLPVYVKKCYHYPCTSALTDKFYVLCLITADVWYMLFECKSKNYQLILGPIQMM